MFDLLIRNALLLDGTGAPARPGDLALSGGRIAAMGRLPGASARRVLEAGGRYLTPGFIDIHRHGDGAMFRPQSGLAEVYQGLTTIVHGNCGLSLAPVRGPYREALLAYLRPITGPAPENCPLDSVGAFLRAAEEQSTCPIHQGLLAGLGTLRAGLRGLEPGALTEEEFAALHRAMEEALAQGALGFSMGLGYAPECFYSTPELIRVLEPLAGSEIPVTVHMRQEGDGVVEALKEMLTVCRTLDLKLEISHLKSIGRIHWGKAVPQMLRMLEEARQEGLRVACDLYPYPAGSTQLLHALPTEYQAGGPEALRQALEDPAQRQRIRRRMETGTDFENIIRLVGFDRVLATALTREENLPLEGKSLAEIAEIQGKDPYDALFDLLLSENGTVTMIDFICSEADLEAILRAPFSSLISDATYPSGGLCHPRVWGSCTRLLETYVQKRKILSPEAAVRKLTSLPAQRLGLRDRGILAPGAWGDLCLFYLENLHETGTWTAPASPARGMDWVFADGIPVLRQGRPTGLGRGSILRGPGRILPKL